MNGPDRDGDESQGIVGVYDMVYGDKETFWLGWELVGDRSYAFHDGLAGIMGKTWTDAQIEELLRAEEDGRDINALVAAFDDTEPEAGQNSFTICRPQLLHLDNDNRPIWFNGWVLNEKHGTYERLSADNFPIFIIEPTDGRKPDPWQLHPGNKCCLTADKAYSFLPEERKVLEMLVEKVLLYNR